MPKRLRKLRCTKCLHVNATFEWQSDQVVQLSVSDKFVVKLIDKARSLVEVICNKCGNIDIAVLPINMNDPKHNFPPKEAIIEGE